MGTFTPPPQGAYVENDAAWAPLTSEDPAAAPTQPVFIPPPTGLYAFNETLGQWVPWSGPAVAGPSVDSFNGRTGAVLPAANDYSFAQISGQVNPNSQIPFATGLALGVIAADGLTTRASAGLMGCVQNPTTVSVSTTITTQNTFLLVDTTAGPVTITLPPLVSWQGARGFAGLIIKNIGTSPVTVATGGGNTFEGGGATLTITDQFGTLSLLASTSIWYIASRYLT